MNDPYVVLGVPRDASREEIDAAYARLTRLYDPPGGPPRPGSDERLAELRRAYVELSDENARGQGEATTDSHDAVVPRADARPWSWEAPARADDEVLADDRFLEPTTTPPWPPSFDDHPVADAPAEPEARPPRRSRNPVDRLTEGLPHGLRVTIDWVVTIAGAVLIVLAIKAWVVNPYRIPSSSMEPTLHCGGKINGCLARFSDRVLANRFIYHLRKPHRGEIVVFNTPPQATQMCGSGGVFVKRIIALPGETWEERNGYTYIDGKKLDEPYVKAGRRDSETYPPRKIPDGSYFMEGDNRGSSCDSRKWGPVTRKELIGPVFMIYWPPNRISFR